MRFEGLFWFCMIAVALIGGIRCESHDAAAQSDLLPPRKVVAARYAIQALELRNVTGRLEIESGTGSHAEVTLEGQADALAGVRRRRDADTLVIAGLRERGPSAGPSGAFLTVRVKVPHGLPLRILGHRGTIVAGDLKGPLVLELREGMATLERIRDARLSLSGPGRIAAGEARGALSIAVIGAGEVLVDASFLERLEIGVTGAGSVDVGGTARFASLSLVGTGHIYVAQAERQPLVQRIGSGEVLIGRR